MIAEVYRKPIIYRPGQRVFVRFDPEGRIFLATITGTTGYWRPVNGDNEYIIRMDCHGGLNVAGESQLMISPPPAP